MSAMRNGTVKHNGHRPRVVRGVRDAVRVVDVCNLASSANTILKHRILAMRARGLDNRVLCTPGRHVAVLEAEGVPVHTIEMPRGFDVPQIIRSFRNVYRYLRKERIELVHTHFSVPGFIGRVAARLAGVPVVVHTIHGFPYHAQSSRLQRAFYVTLERLVGGLADVTLSQNRANLEEALKDRIVPRDRLFLIGNGIKLDCFRPVQRERAAGTPVTIACVARFEWVKNHEMLLRAMALLKQRGIDYRLLLVGAGELQADHERLAARLGIAERVTFCGWRENIAEVLEGSDIATLTSLKEGIPRALMEAMAMSLPVVATRIPGNSDAVVDGETGLLVEPNDVEGLADAMARMIADRALRAEMGARGRDRVKSEFNEEAVIERLHGYYRELLEEKGVVTSARVVPAVGS